MTDNPFASPNGDNRPSNGNGDAAARHEDTEVIPTHAAPSEPEVAPTAAHPVASHPASEQPAAAPLTPASDGTMSTAQPAYDGSGYAAPAAPVKEKKRGAGAGAVAGIAVGALLLGLGGGFAGAWAYDEWGSPSASLSVSEGESVDRDAGSVASVAAAVMPSVVSIESTMEGGSATGSGFVIQEDGYILTNNHVVDGATAITVVFSDGSEHDAEIVGTTADYDLAVIHVDLDGLTPLTFADSDEVVVGDATIAVGSPLGLEGTVTTGIVSSMHRPVTAGDTQTQAYIDALQTDAAINPGNSGGPLLNAKGEVIGVNSAIATLSGTSSETGSIGLGFAIPSNQAQRTAEQLIENGEATYPVIGVQLDGRYTGEGVQVVDDSTGVVEGGPADAAGIEPGDVITAIDGRPITQTDELIVAIRAKAAGDEVTLTVQHGDSSEDITVTLGSSDEVTYEQP
ncbi:trypsin-like peptidase domain-containing protein [Demequina sp. NBRC 110057]|uniref:trypsin-like peptidase domain-containing protein n=1 Tax=Demequina sp. NBRC 110057 TaxID=1570346 RepID=UPI001177C266|nr:trypsin-like peptidase domain-containing protein [Demequina sp. NBRC 110057]